MLAVAASSNPQELTVMSGWPPYVPTAMPPRLPKDDGWMFIYIIGDAEGWQCAACRKMATSGHLRSKKHKVARNNLSLYHEKMFNLDSGAFWTLGLALSDAVCW